MSGRVTPAVRSMEKADVAFQLLEYDYDPSADAIGLQAAHALGRSPSTVFTTLSLHSIPANSFVRSFHPTPA
jgi:Cys-tRNA(Pro)/Cys-tRNA(Cys) deacylase